MGKKRGPKAQPPEAKRRRGNPGKRQLPATADVVQLAPANMPGEIPAPIRTLGVAGQTAWTSAWGEASHWLARSDLHAVQVYCETVDDYAALRNSMYTLVTEAESADVKVAAAAATKLWRVRKQVHDLREQVGRFASELGLTPVSRGALGVAEVAMAKGIQDLTAAPTASRKRT